MISKFAEFLSNSVMSIDVNFFTCFDAFFFEKRVRLTSLLKSSNG